MKVNERIITMINEKNIKIADLSRKTGISQSTITNWVKRDSSPNADMIQAIATAFNVSIEFLITGKEPNTDLTSAEQELLTAFRGLDDISQTKIIGIVEGYKLGQKDDTAKEENQTA